MSDPIPALLRLQAQLLEMHAAALRLKASAIEFNASCKSLYDAFQSGVDRNMAEHPDMAELNVMLDGYYGASNP
ncbi:hypothetical protein [Nocardia sp. NBC_00511]|uniref:hypothetical protein n=1 Tax=Nocardia sp. NBC_00511 TaxID=2903591 RepID=UPI0030E51772